jgi:ATP-dependent RNA helicase RhlE
VTQQTVETQQAKKPELLLQTLKEHDGKILVFTRTKDRCERLGKILDRHGLQSGLLHGGRAQSQRKKALEGFTKGKPRVLVATDLAGRGIDIDDITLVINYDIPGTREDYIHRIGRTARNGKTGTAITFTTPEDVDAKWIISGVKPTPRVVFRSSRRRR